MAIYGKFMVVSAFEWMTVPRFAWFKQPFPVRESYFEQCTISYM